MNLSGFLGQEIRLVQLLKTAEFSGDVEKTVENEDGGRADAVSARFLCRLQFVMFADRNLSLHQS